VKLLRGALAHVPEDPWRVGARALEGWLDAGVAIDAAGRVADLGPFSVVRARHPQAPVVDRRGALILPGLVDAHVHYPQVGVMGALGMPLLRWLETRTLPHEARFRDPTFARAQARIFLRLLARAGTTSAMVFGAHDPGAMEVFFEEAERSGLRVSAGLALGDRGLQDALHTTPDAAYAASKALAQRWHGRGRLRYAITPRFALAATPALLEACGALLREMPGLWVTSHLNETPEEIAAVAALHPQARDYLDTYERAGLVGEQSLFAHNVHGGDAELRRLAAARAVVVHCPSSNMALGSGLFDLHRHRAAGVRLALGSDLGAGMDPCMLHEASCAHAVQRLRGEGLGVAELLYLATAAGAAALGLAAEIGDLRVGKWADLVVVRPPAGSTLAALWAHAADLEGLVQGALAAAREGAIESTWVAGVPLAT
jgi:guanine deaminase